KQPRKIQRTILLTRPKAVLPLFRNYNSSAQDCISHSDALISEVSMQASVGEHIRGCNKDDVIATSSLRERDPSSKTAIEPALRQGSYTRCAQGSTGDCDHPPLCELWMASHSSFASLQQRC